ncbi:uncharacterized protein BDW70DRAFT_129026 [Aspergillus foveolatus]|uniref:uncharacterized protein n=1 Tax=Aspergillus foveolatus TaxID=210207 RepID=UPI003CCE43F9
MPGCFWNLRFLSIVQLLCLVSLLCLYVTSFLLAEQYNLLLPVYRKVHECIWFLYRPAVNITADDLLLAQLV